MNHTPKVAFIVVCWNNHDLLGECFDSIKSQTYKEHITVMVDNGSSDDSVSFTKLHFPEVHIVESNNNLGFARGNNLGIRTALEKYPSIEYFVFLNTDARLSANWLSVLVEFAKNKPRLALMQSTTLDYYDHNITDSTHIYISQNGAGTQSGWRKPARGDKGPRKVFGVNAAAAIISRNYVEKQPFRNLFDETMFMYLEDVDLSARATVMGWDNYHVPGTFAYHMGSATSGKNPGYSLYMTYRNNVAVLFKNLPFTMLVKMLPSVLMSDYRTIRHLFTTNRGRLSIKIIKGRIMGVLRLPLYIPGIIKMHPARKKIDKNYLWLLMKSGEIY